MGGLLVPENKETMQVTTKAIVLRAIKYGETSLIVKMYTLSSGIRSYMLKGILAAKKGKMKAAYFQPLAQLEIVAVHKDKGALEHLKEVRVSYHCQSLHTHIAKNAITFFLAEMIANSIHEEEPNKELFQFIEASLQWLDAHDNYANFHLLFLLTLSRFLGFYPEEKNKDFPYFDLLEGEFVKEPTLNSFLEGRELFYFKSILGISFDAIEGVRIGKNDRKNLLNNLVLFYELQLQGFRKPKSLAVLNEVFS
ncbi:DNA repair protein RecO [Arenibacter latericius]|uniref:DNA repair protein RecO n=1 Tax=Arenibacter latericius TaxID=86104 RepID=UPI00041C8F41|nr:DNA repair protein RecO [Arenibacter latericius]MDX1363699.1 DNA repair protein RecO [Arenibacter latericius]